MWFILAAALVVLRAALLIFREVTDMRAHARPAAGPRSVTHRTVRDPWIADLYPADFAGPHEDEPRLHHRRQGSYRGPGSLSPAACDDLVIEHAFQLEFRARRMFAGAQFRGILRGDTSIVWAASPAHQLRTLLADHTPGPAAREHLDRALSWWLAALAAGMRVFEWDRPGYDEVTQEFRGLDALATRILPIDPRAHGVEVRSTTHLVDPPPPPDHGWAVIRIFFLVVIAIFITAVVCAHECPRGANTPPPTCAEHHAKLDARVAELLARGHTSDPEPALTPAQLAALQQVQAALAAGHPNTAHALWDAARDDQPGAALLAVELFLYALCPQPTASTTR